MYMENDSRLLGTTAGTVKYRHEHYLNGLPSDFKEEHKALSEREFAIKAVNFLLEELLKNYEETQRKLGIYWYLFRNWIVLYNDEVKIADNLNKVKNITVNKRKVFEFIDKETYFSKKYTLVVKNVISALSLRNPDYSMQLVMSKYESKIAETFPIARDLGYGYFYVGENLSEVLAGWKIYDNGDYWKEEEKDENFCERYLTEQELLNFIILPLWDGEADSEYMRLWTVNTDFMATKSLLPIETFDYQVANWRD